jgi:integrase
MSIQTRTTKDGTKLLWIYLVFRNRQTGAQERYRRDAQVQTRAGAQAEERRIQAHFVQHGTIAGLIDPPKPEKKAETHTWDDAVTLYEGWAESHLKPSTRAGYAECLASPWFQGWAGEDVAKLSQDAAKLTSWDDRLAKGLGESRRRNMHVAMRTVMRVAELEGWHPGLVSFHTGFGKGKKGLPKVGGRAVHAMNPADVEALLGESDEGVPPRVAADRQASRFALALACFAGLRASEVRGLRWANVDLRAKVIHVKETLIHGETSTPKSKNQRTVPVPEKLLKLLQEAKDARKPEADDYVAPSRMGTPFSDKTLYHALRRACDRLGLEASRVHALRHYFVTALFRGGVNPRVAQKLAGHSTLEVTMRYADAVDSELADAVKVFDGPGLKVIDGGRSRKAS